MAERRMKRFPFLVEALLLRELSVAFEERDDAFDEGIVQSHDSL